MRAQRVERRVYPRQLLVAGRRVDGAMADRVERHGFAPALALRDDVVTFRPPAERTAAQRAGLRRVAQGAISSAARWSSLGGASAWSSSGKGMMPRPA